MNDTKRMVLALVGAYLGFSLFLSRVPVFSAIGNSQCSRALDLLGPLVMLVLGVFAVRNAPKVRVFSQKWLSSITILLSATFQLLVLSGTAFASSGQFVNLARLFSGLFLGLSIAFLVTPVVGKGKRVRMLLDSLVIAFGTLVVGWFAVIGPLVAQFSMNSRGRPDAVISLTIDCLIIAAVIRQIHHGIGSKNRTGILALLSSLALFGLSDVTRVTGTVPLSEGFGRIIGVVGVFLALFSSFAVLFGPNSSRDAEVRNPSLPQQALPYLTLPIVFYVVMAAALGERDLIVVFGAIVGAAVTIVILMLRQLVALKDNSDLLADLSKTNNQLETQSQQIESQNQSLLSLNTDLDLALKRVEQANVKLMNLATTDALTGLPNQRAFQGRLKEEFSRAVRQGAQLSVVMLDVDHFKSYNDNFGHPAGDDVLRLVGSALKSVMRDSDFFARYGGEEFVCILPDTSESQSLEICERMRLAVDSLKPQHRRVSVSVGVAGRAFGQSSAQELLEQADFALYAAKKRGRNRVVAHGEVPKISQSILDEAIDREPALPGSTLLAIKTAAGLSLPTSGSERDLRLLQGILAALDLRNAEPEGHVERVMWMSLRLALELNNTYSEAVTTQVLRELAIGSLLHDVGKIGVSDLVLSKKGHLEVHEFAALRRHTTLGSKFIGQFPNLACALPVIRSHHERWDGTGYPDGLAGESIPLSARVFSVCDAFEAMTHDRAHRSSLTIEEAKEELTSHSGTQFDPSLVEAFLAISSADWIRIQVSDVGFLIDRLQTLSDSSTKIA